MSSVCIQLVVVAVTLLLSDVTCQTVHNINISDEVHSDRQRRQAQPLTQKQISEIVDHHNVLRSREGAADMKLMVWNTSLASMAATWAARCTMSHPDYKDIGQNIFVTGARSGVPSAKRYIDGWYSEKPGNGGHYKQVVWANSGNVGCGVHRCPGGTFVVCNYSPAGNYRGQSPYTKGPACSKCSNGAGWCKNKLCNTQCTSAGEGCSCAAICYNCGVLDLETCQCKCAKGWRGVDCTVRCKNTEEQCYKLPKSMCSDRKYGPGMRQRCPALCGLCEENQDAEEGPCPPVRGPAADRKESPDAVEGSQPPVRGPAAESSAQTMFIKNHQSTMIFVMIVITFTINSYDTL